MIVSFELIYGITYDFRRILEAQLGRIPVEQFEDSVSTGQAEQDRWQHVGREGQKSDTLKQRKRCWIQMIVSCHENKEHLKTSFKTVFYYRHAFFLRYFQVVKHLSCSVVIRYSSFAYDDQI